MQYEMPGLYFLTVRQKGLEALQVAVGMIGADAVH